MSASPDQRAAEFYAQTYDVSVPDWPGEIDFYRAFSTEVRHNQESLLEVACGTGRVAIRLAQDGTQVVGLDLSPQMIVVARGKSRGIPNLSWVLADMRSFELEGAFGLAIIPGHAFQNLNTPQDQVACLESIQRHLIPGGRLIVHLDHQDMSWLGELMGERGGRFEPAEQFRHPHTGQQIRTSRAWSYEPAAQTATCVTLWEAIAANGEVLDRWQKQPVRLHCVFPFEMEHLLARVDYSVEAVYGDFFRQPLSDQSSEMIWVVRKPG
jgi:SAM-dependent methyltransferase